MHAVVAYNVRTNAQVYLSTPIAPQVPPKRWRFKVREVCAMLVFVGGGRNKVGTQTRM
jgi:hypothetical protein